MVENQSVGIYPPNIFVLKMLSAFYVCCLYSNALQTRLNHGSKHYELFYNIAPDQTAPKGSSLIRGHIVCNIGYRYISRYYKI